MSRSPAAPSHRWSAVWRSRKVLWLLVRRDLKVRYADSFLGYLWSVLDPLLMSGVYWFVFTVVFQRSVGEEPYIVFLISALLPWTWFSNSTTDSLNAIRSQAKLVRSTALPREIWVLRVVIAKGVEFAISLPVLALFVIFYPPQLNADLALFPVAVLVQVVLLTGMALFLAPVTVLLRDTQPLVKVALRFLFYASPVIYGLGDVLGSSLPDVVQTLYLLNPMSGILTTYRAGFFDGLMDWTALGVAAAVSLATLAVGAVVFRRLENDVLKEI